jgi:hypothetical protein
MDTSKSSVHGLYSLSAASYKFAKHTSLFLGHNVRMMTRLFDQISVGKKARDPLNTKCSIFPSVGKEIASQKLKITAGKLHLVC